MTQILQWIGWVLLKIYQFFDGLGIPGAYALALVIFSLVFKLILFPFSYRGKKSMMRTTALQGRMKQLEQQYGKNRERYQQEVQKLYQEEKINPMSGCLWQLLPLVVLMALYYIIRRPLLYMMAIPNEAIQTAIEAVTNAGYTLSTNAAYQEIQLASLLNEGGALSVVQSAIPEYANNLHIINFNLFGLDLAQTPHLMFWKYFDTLGVWGSVGLFLIPLAVTALNILYSRYSTKSNQALTAVEDETSTKKKKKKAEDDKPALSSTERSTRMMMWLMPLMYLYFGYIMPAGMCVYMAVNALTQMGQDAICVKMMRKSFLEMQEEQKRRAEAEKAALAARKAEIAERRRLQEEANKANKGKKRKKAVKPAAKPVNKNGRIGIRAYALGRDYEPDRYGGVTAYRDPQEIIDEQAVEEAYKKKRRRKVEAVEKAIAEAEEVGDLEAVEALEAKQAALEAAEEAAEEAEEAAIEAAEGEGVEALTAGEEAAEALSDEEEDAETAEEAEEADDSPEDGE